MSPQLKSIAGLSAAFAVYALTAGLVSRGILALMDGHSAAQGIGWQADILMSNPAFQGMYFLMIFTVVSATFLGFALVWGRMRQSCIAGQTAGATRSNTTGRAALRTGDLS